MISEGGYVYLTDEDALDAVDHMGLHIKDLGLLSSAVARPRASAFGQDAYPDVITKSAALFESLVRNHALHDGNTRHSVALTWVFLELNGVPLSHSVDEAFDFALATAAGKLDLEQIRDWFADHAVPLGS